MMLYFTDLYCLYNTSEARDIGSGDAAPMFLRSISDWETVGVRVWGKTGALIITYTILVVPYSNYGIMAPKPYSNY